MRTNLFIPSHFWTTHVNFDNCCQHYSDVWKKNSYRYTSTFSALNCCSGISLKSFYYLYEVVRTNFSADFCSFSNLRPQFCKIVVPSGNRNGHSLVPSEENGENNQNRPINCDTLLVQSMSPLNKQRAEL